MRWIDELFGGLTAGQWFGLIAPFWLLMVVLGLAWWDRHQSERSDARGCPEYHQARLTELTVMARHVLGGAEAERWMRSPQPMLGGHTPEAMTWNRDNAAKVERLLYAIAQGMPGIVAESTASRSGARGEA